MAEVATLFKQFIYRDLAFVFGGFIVLLSLAYAFSGCIPNVWKTDYWKEFPAGGIVLIVLAAYVVGYTVQDIGGILRLTPTGRLMEMDAAFCLQMRRAHSEREIVGAGAEHGVATPPALHRAALVKAKGADDAVRAF